MGEAFPVSALALDLGLDLVFGFSCFLHILDLNLNFEFACVALTGMSTGGYMGILARQRDGETER